jgi:hypothetical protein
VTKASTSALIAAAILAGCAGSTPTPSDTRHPNDRPLPPGEGAFGSAFTYEWRQKEDPAKAAAAAKPAAAAPATAAAGDAEEFRKWRESAGSAERKEFEDWRAWQEWKRRNPK